METLGSLVDKLVIVNLKLWHVQDWVHSMEKESADICKFSPAEMVGNIRKLCVLNKQRNSLMTEIDRILDGAVRNKEATVEERIKL